MYKFLQDGLMYLARKVTRGIMSDPKARVDRETAELAQDAGRFCDHRRRGFFLSAVRSSAARSKLRRAFL
jgi:hypothetical protein